MQPTYVISLQWLDEIIAAITNFLGEKAAAFASALGPCRSVYLDQGPRSIHTWSDYYGFVAARDIQKMILTETPIRGSALGSKVFDGIF